jgi:hypothetical protein
MSNRVFLWHMYFLQGQGIGDPGSGINPQGGSRGSSFTISAVIRTVETPPLPQPVNQNDWFSCLTLRLQQIHYSDLAPQAR